MRSQLANFGHIPYGQSLTGLLFFNISNLHGCEEPGAEGLEAWYRRVFGEGEVRDGSGNRMPIIFLVKRSAKCSYVQQVRNVQNSGGAMAIIANTQVGVDVEEEVMSDDGTGSTIHIPSLLISYRDGYILEKHFLHTKPHHHNQTVLKVEFITEYKWDTDDNQVVSVDFWYNPADDRSLDFISSVARYVEPLTKYIDFKPKIVTW